MDAREAVVEFLKNKVYRKSYIIYILSLFLLSIVVCVTLCNTIINSQVQEKKRAARNAFEKAESTIALNISKIDNYVLNIYSNPLLQKDFLCFFGNNAETYITQRLRGLTNDDRIASFLQDLRKFITDNQYTVSLVSLEAQESANTIRFYESGTTDTAFSVPSNTIDSLQDDISCGYLYSVELANPSSLSERMGEVRFLLNSHKLFRDINGYNIASTAIISKKGSLYYAMPSLSTATPSPEDLSLKQEFAHIYESGSTDGAIRKGVFNTLYYFVNTSEYYGYKMITAVDTDTIWSENGLLFLIVILASLVTFASMTLLITMGMNRDAKFLNRIVNAIHEAKSGNFAQVEIGSRKDEYAIIGQELNEMTMRLDEHIRTEYILKLKQQEAEMKALQHQINPHFLYNTLEIIRSCALVNHDEKVADAVYNLGGMYRDLVKAENIITIDMEVELLTKYLKIMEFKHSGSFFYQIDIAASVRALSTVKFWMQPVVENYFVHGFDKGSEFNLLLVSGREEPDRYVIDIINNGKKMEPQKLEELFISLAAAPEGTNKEGIGLPNVYQRLKFFYGDNAELLVTNNAEAGITVSVRIYKEDFSG